MHTRYRISLVSLALLALSIAPPASAAQEATSDPATQAAHAARSAAIAAGAPMQFSDFVGSWHHHGYVLTVYPDGSAVAVWRTYDGDKPEAPGGNAALRFSRVEGHTLYGTNPNSATRASVALTEYEYGVGFLADEPNVAAPDAPYNPQAGVTLCGPRYATAPEWFRGTSPCGA
jgi:hypothetical protein